MRILSIFALGVLAAQAIVWRADLESVETRAEAEMKQAGVVLYSPLQVFGGCCVALGGKWVLTCRHGTDKWKAGFLRVSFPALGKTVYQVEEIRYPAKGDFALLRVDKAVCGAKQMEIYDGDDEVGRRAWIGGFGMSGPTGKLPEANGFHSGHNRIDAIRGGKLSISLSRPDDPAAESDEAVLAVFDSGSPMFVETKDGWRLAGIGSSATNRAGPGYGDRGNYARVATAREWIEEVTGK